MGQLRPREELENGAAALVCHELGARGVKRRDLGGSRIRDFDLVFADCCEPLEMTVLADTDVLQTRARVRREGFIEVPGMRRRWFSTVPMAAAGRPDEPVDVNAVKRALIPVLLALEEQGDEKLDVMKIFHQPELRRASLELMSLDVTLAHSMEPPDGVGGLELSMGGGGAVGESLVTDAVAREACKSDNREKLGACAGAIRRHLCVLVSGQERGMTLTALHHVLDGSFPLPPVPELPPEITTVWAITATRGLYVTPPDSWQTFRAPDGLFDTPPELLGND